MATGTVNDLYTNGELKNVFDYAAHRLYDAHPGLLAALQLQGQPMKLDAAGNFTIFGLQQDKGASTGFANLVDNSIAHIYKSGAVQFGVNQLSIRATALINRTALNLVRMAQYQAAGQEGLFLDEARTKLDAVFMQMVNAVEMSLNAPVGDEGWMHSRIVSGSTINQNATGNIVVEELNRVMSDTTYDVFDSTGATKKSQIVVQSKPNGFGQGTVKIYVVGSNYTPAADDILSLAYGAPDDDNTSGPQNFFTSFMQMIATSNYPPTYATQTQIDTSSVTTYVSTRKTASGAQITRQMIAAFAQDVEDVSPVEVGAGRNAMQMLVNVRGTEDVIPTVPQFYIGTKAQRIALLSEMIPLTRYSNVGSTPPEIGKTDGGLGYIESFDGLTALWTNQCPADTFMCLVPSAFALGWHPQLITDSGNLGGYRRQSASIEMEYVSVTFAQIIPILRNALGAITNVTGISDAGAGLS